MKPLFKTAAVLGAVVAGLPSGASEGGAGGAALLTPDYGTIFWTFLTFIVLVLLLGRFAWKPILGAIDAREQSIRDSIDGARKDREQAESLVAEQKELLTAARRERAEAIEQGKRDAEKTKEEILEQARQQREQVLSETQTQIAAGLRKAQGKMRGEVVSLAILAAEKLLTKNLDDATQRRLVEEHLADLERRSGGSSALPS